LPLAPATNIIVRQTQGDRTMATPTTGTEAPRLDLPLRLQTARTDGLAVRILEFTHAEGGELPAFEAGAHLLVEAAPGVVRSYSLCNAPGNPERYQLGVLLEEPSRGGSLAMHALRPGQVIRTSVPRNAFELDESAPYSLLLAGGIGITPLIAMAERLAATGRDFELHYCCRERQRASFLERLHEPRFAGRVHLHFDNGAPDQRFEAHHVLASCPRGTHIYTCGPLAFMDHVFGAARTAGWADQCLHREDFAATPAPNTGAQATTFELVMAKSGKTVRVDAGETALAALERAGAMVFSSCQEGICGTCVVPVLEGQPDHRDQYLTDDARARNDCFLPCCSRSLTPQLVIDL
jgi:vanillate monooxygenase ferredoxin subunit